MGQPNPVATDGRLLVNDILAHHGVTGMKWGVRRSDPRRIATQAVKVIRSTPKTSETKKTFHAKVSESGGLHKVNDKDLKAMLSRLDMEKKYTTIQSEDAAKRAEHRKAALKVLGEVGKIALPIILGAVAAKVASNHNPGVYRTQAYTPGHPVIDGVSKVLGS